MNQLEQITQMFSSIDADDRRYVMGVLRNEFERVQAKRKTSLRLVVNSQPNDGTIAARRPDEAALLDAYRALVDHHQHNMLGLIRDMAKHHPRDRAAMTLVHGGAPQKGGAQ